MSSVNEKLRAENEVLTQARRAAEAGKGVKNLSSGQQSQFSYPLKASILELEVVKCDD